MIKNALEGKPLGIYGDGKNVRDWIHVEDHCTGVLKAFEAGVPGNTYCFGGRAERNNNQVVDLLTDLLDQLHPRSDKKSYKEQITYVTDRPGHDARYAIDDRFAEKELGFQRNYDFDSGLKATVQWYLDNQKWVHQVLNKK